MPRTAPAEVRLALIERAAELLARREALTLRGVVAGTGQSTMAVYTHFGAMAGLRSAVRQEGFTRLATTLGDVPQTRDPVRDLAALGAAYVTNALCHPDLYRAMFDPHPELADPGAAAATFTVLVGCVARARAAGRFGARTDPAVLATRYWAAGHGLASLVLGCGLSRDDLDTHGAGVTLDLCVAAGDDPDRCRRSVRAGWTSIRPR